VLRFDFDVCSKAVTSADPRSGQRKEPLISAQCRRRPMLQRLSNKHNGGKSRGGHGGDASQIGMAEKESFRVGLARMRMGVHLFYRGPVVGQSIVEMMQRYEQQRDKEFTSHVCAEHPRATKNPR